MTSPRVFISYTAEDLHDFAGVVRDVVRRLEWIAVDHTDWPSTGRPSVAECRERVQGCHILVVLVAHRYGWVPSVEEGGDGRTSITWLEVAWARSSGLEVLPYVVRPDASWSANLIEALTKPDTLAPLTAFKAELQRSLAKFFSDRGSLLETLECSLRAAVERQRSRGAVPRPEARAPVTGPRRTGLVPPEELPYLCDRDDQEGIVQVRLRDHLRTSRQRPLLFVVHGPANEAHRSFVERLRNDVMSARGLKGLGITGTLRFLHVPRRVRAGSDFDDDLRTQMANELQMDDPRDDADFVDGVRRLGLGGIAPVITLLASESAAEARTLFARVKDYWSAFPDLPAPLIVIPLVCVKYTRESSERASGWRFLRWRSSGDDDEPMREAVRSSQGANDPSARVAWHVLPELPRVRPEHVDRWTDRDRVREWIGDVSSERREAIFAGSDSLPMETIAPRLRALLLEPQPR